MTLAKPLDLFGGLVRVPAMNRWTSPTAVDRSVSAASKPVRLSSTTLVSVAKAVLELHDLLVAVRAAR